MRNFKKLFINSLAIASSGAILFSYDYFSGNNFIYKTKKLEINSPSAAIDASAAQTVTYAQVVGTSAIRQLVKSPIEVNYSKDDTTPLVVSTGTGGEAPSTYLAKFRNEALGEDSTVLTISNTGALQTNGEISAEDAELDSIDTGKIKLSGVLKFKSKTNDPTTSGSGSSKYGLLWLGNEGNDLYFMDSGNEKNTVLLQDSNGRVGIGTQPVSALTIYGDASEDSDYEPQITLVGQSNTPTVVLSASLYDGSSPYVGTSGEHTFSIVTDNEYRLRVDEDGDVYIGKHSSDSTNTTLEVATYSTSVGPSLKLARLNSEGQYTGGWSIFNSGSSQVGGLGNLTFYDSVGTTMVMVMTPDGYVGIGNTGPTEKLDIEGDTIRLRDDKTPASATADCNQGEIVWDASYVYVCVADDTWKRSALSTW